MHVTVGKHAQTQEAQRLLTATKNTSATKAAWHSIPCMFILIPLVQWVCCSHALCRSTGDLELTMWWKGVEGWEWLNPSKGLISTIKTHEPKELLSRCRKRTSLFVSAKWISCTCHIHCRTSNSLFKWCFAQHVRRLHCKIIIIIILKTITLYRNACLCLGCSERLRDDVTLL